MIEKIRIGCGAGFSGDWIEPALILTEQGNLDYLVLDASLGRSLLWHKRDSNKIRI